MGDGPGMGGENTGAWEKSEPEPENLRSAATTFWVTFNKDKNEQNPFLILSANMLDLPSDF